MQSSGLSFQIPFRVSIMQRVLNTLGMFSPLGVSEGPGSAVCTTLMSSVLVTFKKPNWTFIRVTSPLLLNTAKRVLDIS
jgi:hypothetical protein